MTEIAPIIRLEHVRRDFAVRASIFARKKNLQAVRGVSFSVVRGESFGIVGESGCGKTTLIRMMLGLVPPSSGMAEVLGEPIACIDRRRLTRRIQPVFQDPYASLDPRRTVADIVVEPLVAHRIGDRASRRARALALIDRVGIPRRAVNSYPNQLSGGQRQRVAIARALSIEPEVLICDEPTSALDVSVQSQVLNLLKTLKGDMDLTIIFVSHNLAVIRHMATRVAVMYAGEIVETGSTEQIFREPRHPYTRALLDSILTPDPSLGLPEVELGMVPLDPTAPPVGCAFQSRCPLVRSICREIAPPGRHKGTAVAYCHLA